MDNGVQFVEMYMDVIPIDVISEAYFSLRNSKFDTLRFLYLYEKK